MRESRCLWEFTLDELMKSNRKTKLLLGVLDKNNKLITENIPSVNRSQYSQERYQFFLEAPFEISNMCCNVMKKEPAHRYFRKTGRKPITAQMASESRLRTQIWINNGCNGFDLKIPTSNPMSFWTEQDVLLYIREYGNRMANNPWRIKPKSEEVMKYGKRIVYRSTGGTAPYYPKEMVRYVLYMEM